MHLPRGVVHAAFSNSDRSAAGGTTGAIGWWILVADETAAYWQVAQSGAGLDETGETNADAAPGDSVAGPAGYGDIQQVGSSADCRECGIEADACCADLGYPCCWLCTVTTTAHQEVEGA